jgi:hypothetical protein
VTWLGDGGLGEEQWQLVQQELDEVLQFAVFSIVVEAREPQTEWGRPVVDPDVTMLCVSWKPSQRRDSMHRSQWAEEDL